jgi:4-amino-4-deoxy-L-arabinose transferase-like glycosyltransferase
MTRHHTIVLVLIMFSIVMSTLVSRVVFERLPHLEDEVAYLFQAKTYAGGRLVVDTPEPRRAYWQPFVVDYAPTGERFSKYTPGWPALFAIGVLLGQPWIINAFLSGLTVALVFRLGREIFNPDVGVIAAALTAFSPMAILLNATLMGHTAALFAVTLFFYAYWRIEQGRRPLRWGIVAGIALGLVVTTRPLTAVGIGAPFIAWSALRLLMVILRRGEATPRPGQGIALPLQTFMPLFALTLVTLIISATIPIYNYAATHQPMKNLYTLVWPYDRVGFGAANEYGRSGHTLEKGFRHVRFDLSLMAADLYGWQIGSLTTTPFDSATIKPEIQNQLLNEGDYWPFFGVSWVLLPLGLIVGLRRRSGYIIAWFALGFIIITQTLSPPFGLPTDLLQNSVFAWIWWLVAMAWLCLPQVILAFKLDDSQVRWTWLLAAAAMGLIIAHFTYWIGSQRYSTRYYFEGLTALSILSALPIAWLIQKLGKRWLIYGALTVALLYSLYAYSTPRISALYRYNFVGQDRIDAITARREGDRPVLVLVRGNDVRWRATGALMSITSPFLDSDVVVAWDNLQPGVRDAILARFPDRQVIEMEANGNESWFKGEGQ